MQTHCIWAQILAFLSHTVEANTLYAVSYCCQLIYLQNSQLFYNAVLILNINSHYTLLFWVLSKNRKKK